MDYTTLAKIKEYLGITDTSSDALLTTLISQLSATITGFIGRDIFEETITDEEYDGCNPNIFLKKYPVTSLDTNPQRRTGNVSTPTWVDYGDNDFILYADAGYVHFFAGTPHGHLNLRFDYTGGYATVPLDLELLANQLIAQAFNKTKAQGIKKVSIEGSTIEYTTVGEGNLTKQQMSVIKKYTDYNVGEVC